MYNAHSLARIFVSAFLGTVLLIALPCHVSGQVDYQGSALIDFTGYGGAGLTPTPAGNQLDSDDWLITGLSDGIMNFGGTYTTGDFARGNTASGGVGTGGLYAYNNGALWFQPGGDDLTPGSIVLRVQNNTGSTIQTLQLAYDILYLNDQDRSNSLTFSYSSDDVSYTDIGALDFASPEALDALGVQSENKSFALSGLAIGAGDFLYLRWSTDDVSGSGSRDEIGLDDISLSGPIENLDQGSFYNTIQEAIDDAMSGETIEIQVADHTEGQVHVDKSLTIQGLGKTLTTVHSSYNTASGGHSNDASAWIRTDPGTAVLIRDMTLDATGFDTYTAVRFKSTGNVENVAFNEIKHSASPYLGIAVQAQDGVVDVTGCMFTQIGRIGVHFRAGVIVPSSISGSFTNNMYLGKGNGDWLDYALDISGGTYVVVLNNEISNNTGVASSDGSTSAGILVTTYFPLPNDTEANDVTIAGNNIHDNTAGIVVGYNPGDISVVNAYLNDIHDNGFGITSTGPPVTAQNNYWGAADGPGGDFPGTGDPIDGPVYACPYYDGPVATGSPVDCPVKNVTLMPNKTYPTIQEAIDDPETLDGHMIEVSAATYFENVVVNKELTITGAGQGSTFVIPAISGPDVCIGSSLCPGASNVFLIQANNVTIQELTIDGDNPGIMSGVTTMSADLDARNGIITDHTMGTFTNLNVNHVTVQNVYLRGIYASSGGTFNFNNNTVSNVQGELQSIAMMNYGGAGIFTGNTVMNSNDGIVSNYSSGTTYSDNAVSLCASGIHSDNNSSGTADLIMNNTVTTGAGGNSYGIFVFNPELPVQVTGNTITDVNVGLACTGTLSVLNPTITFSQNTVDAQGRPSSTGMYPTNQVWGYGDGNTTVVFVNNFVLNTTDDAFYVETSDTYIIDLTANDNSIEGNVNGVNVEGTGTATQDLMCNWWGNSSYPAITAAVGEGENFIPVLIDGTDDDGGTAGFQPVAGACVILGPVHNLSQNTYYNTIQAAEDDADPNDVIEVSAGIYPEHVTVDVAGLTIQGETGMCGDVVIDGEGVRPIGISVLANTLGVTIQDLSVQNTNGLSNDAGVRVFVGCDGLGLFNLCVSDASGRGGIYVDGPVDGVTIDDCEVSGSGVDGRGIVVWNGFKEHVTLTNNYIHDISGCCGIELQDGSASAVTMTGNTVERTGDSGMSAVGLNGSTGANTISNNTITNTGRFGLEIKNPSGNGTDILIDNNVISNPDFSIQHPGELRDMAGIAVMRRSVGPGNVEVPTGVQVTNNQVSDYLQSNAGSVSEGFGIVIEGIDHTINGNTVSGCNIGIQQQAGHTPLPPADGNQNNLADQYFGRGNCQSTCGNDVSGNFFSGNSTDTRNVSVTSGSVLNMDSGDLFCSIQDAIDDAGTGNGHTLSVSSGTYDENIVVNKSLTILGANANVSCDVARGAESVIAGTGGEAVSIQADGVTINGFTINNPVGSFGIYAHGHSSLTINFNIISDIGDDVTGNGPTYGVAVEVSTGNDISNISVSENCISDIRGGENTSLTGAAAKANNGSGGAIAAGFSTADFNMTSLSITENIITNITACTQDFADGGKGAYGIIVNVGASGSHVGQAVNPQVTANEISTLSGHWAHGIGLEGATPGATVENNAIDNLSDTKPADADAVGVMVEDNDGAMTIDIHNNSLTDLEVGVKNVTSTLIDAECNWYGAADAPSVAAANSGMVDYTPWLIDDTDASATTGFQPVSGACDGTPIEITATTVDQIMCGESSGEITVDWDGGVADFTVEWTGGGSMSGITMTSYTITGLAAGAYDITVTDAVGTTATTSATVEYLPVTNTSGPSYYATIQEAIDAASANDILEVCQGTYAENLLVDKPLDLRGSNYGISPNGGVRGPESILHPATSDPDPNSLGAVTILYLTDAASGTSINGFLFDGDNPLLVSGVVINTADIDAIECISGYDGTGDLTITKNILQNVTYAGMDLYNYFNSGGVTTNNVIEDNKIDNVAQSPYGIGILIYNNFYAQIEDNVISNVRVGVQTGNFYTSNTGSTNSISNNEITSERRGIFHNLAYGSASAFDIENNIISTTPGAANHLGISLSSLGGTVGANVNNNTVDGAYAGVDFWNCTSSNTITVTGGSMSNCDYGIFASNYDGYNSDANSGSVAISGVSISGSNVAGVIVKDNPLNSNGATIHLTIGDDCEIEGTTQLLTGILISGADASATIQDNDASIHGFAVGIDVDGGMATITNNHIYDNGIGVRFINGGYGDVNTNNFDGDADPDNDTDLLAAASAGAVSATPDNAFAGESFGVENLSGTTIDATYCYWESADGPAPNGSGAAVSDDVLYCPWLADTPVAFGGTGTVADGPFLNTVSMMSFCSLQDAINDAGTMDGDIIEVQPGEYTEIGQIVISKDLTIIGTGAGCGDVVFHPSANTGSSGDPRGWWLVEDGVELNLQYVTLDGDGFLIWQAIRDKGHGDLDNVCFLNILFNESGPSYAGTAVAAFGSAPAIVNVTNCTFSNIGRIGVQYFGDGVNGSLYDGNTYTGKGAGDWLDYGVEVGAGAQVTISNSTVNGNTGVASSDGSTSAGVLVTTFFGPGSAAMILNNDLSGNSAGIAVGYDSSDGSTVEAHQNDLSDNPNGGVINTNTGNILDATLNWWGDATGPSTVGFGSGAPVSDGVLYCPWLDDVPPAGMPVNAAAFTISIIENSGTAPNDGEICIGDMVTLDATTPNATYLWSPGGEMTPSINVSPLVTTMYSCTVTVPGGCEDADTVTIFVNPLPVFTLTADGNVVSNGGTIDTLCVQDTVAMMVSGDAGATFVLTYDMLEVASGNVNDPAFDFVACIDMEGEYVLTVTGSTGCQESLTFTVEDVSICPGPSTLEWVYLPPGSPEEGSCPGVTNCCTDTFCFALMYTPGVTGVMTSYTTGFFINCLGFGNPVLSNQSCVMIDNSSEDDQCTTESAVLINSSGNFGDTSITAGVPIVLHKLCLNVPTGESISLMEDIVTDLTVSVDIVCGGFHTEFPDYSTTNFTKPIPVIPADDGTTVACLSEAVAPALTNAEDLCGNPIVPVLDEFIDMPDPITCEGTRQYYYNYTDCSGYNQVWTYTYTIDYEDFTITDPPGGSVVSCPDATDIFPVRPDVMDNCGIIITDVDTAVSAKPVCEGFRYYTFTYTDCAGFTHDWIYSYSVEYEPFTMPLDDGETVSCFGDIDVDDVTPPELTDNCGELLMITGPVGPVLDPDPLDCEGTVTYTWTYTDCEGNMADWNYVYTVEMGPPAEVGGPAVSESSVECVLDAMPPDPEDLPMVADNCGNVLMPSAPVVGGTYAGGCGGTVTYTYVYTNCADQEFEWVYTYHIDCQQVQVRVFLEGPYDVFSHEMLTTMNDIHVLPGQKPLNPFITPAPFGQPYQGPPWNYATNTGETYGDAAHPDAPPDVEPYPGNVVDWILVTVRENGIMPGDNIWTCAGWVMNDGNVIFPENCGNIPLDPFSDYYVLVQHRNHLGVLDTASLTCDNQILTIDFTIENSYQPAFRSGQKQIEPGVWAMFGGNGEQVNSIVSISSADLTLWAAQQNSLGYFTGDYQLNGNVNSADESVWINNQNRTSGIIFY